MLLHPVFPAPCCRDDGPAARTSLTGALLAAAVFAAAGAAAEEPPCDQVRPATVSRAVDLPVTDPTARPARQQPGDYVLHQCEWTVVGEDGGVIVLSLRLAADDARNRRDIRQMQADRPHAHPDTVVEAVPGIGDYSEFAYSARSNWAGLTALKGTIMAAVMAWNVRGLGKASLQPFVTLVREVLEGPPIAGRTAAAMTSEVRKTD